MRLVSQICLPQNERSMPPLGELPIFSGRKSSILGVRDTHRAASGVQIHRFRQAGAVGIFSYGETASLEWKAT